MTAVMLLTFGSWVSWEDGRRMMVPDRAIVAGLGLLGLGTLTRALPPAEALLGLLLALAQMGLVYLLFRRPRRMGLGDVKYACLLGGLLGPVQWIAALLLASFAALVHIVIISIFQKGLFRDKIPFAPYLTAGGLAASISGMGVLTW